MKFLRGVIGYMITGLLVFSSWGQILSGELGVFGGILAGFLLIGVAWFMNHHLGLIYHAPNSGFVDQGLGVGFTGLFQGLFTGLLITKDNGKAFFDALPTLVIVVLGACVGGYLAALVEADLAKDKGDK